MWVLVKNAVTGDLSLPNLVLKPGEQKKILFTEQVRYYIASGYIKVLQKFTELEPEPQK